LKDGALAENGKDYLKTFNRLLIWPTLVLFILLAISGYAILNPRMVDELTGGLFSHSFSLYLHEALVLPTLTLILIHVLIGIRTAMIRWGMREGKLLNAFLLLLAAFALLLIVSLQFLLI
jgi:cytochrome b subunit of formate dehydrogenase